MKKQNVFEASLIQPQLRTLDELPTGYVSVSAFLQGRAVGSPESFSVIP